MKSIIDENDVIYLEDKTRVISTIDVEKYIERTKKDTIGEACQYLRDNIDPKLTIYNDEKYCSLEEFIANFRKAMTEQ